MNMYAAPSSRLTVSAGPRAAGIPVTFGGVVGLFSPAAYGTAVSRLGVLFASPWGLEEMCTRKFNRLLAEQLSDSGIASLRFDYPGTGDALDPPDWSAGLKAWSNSLVQAAEKLRALSGCQQLVILSQGLGTVVAIDAAESIAGIEALVLAAPVTSGRTHLRELSVWSRLIDGNLGIAEEVRPKDGLWLASQHLPDAIAQDVRKANLLTLAKAPASRLLLLSRPDRSADHLFVQHLLSLGVDLTERPFDGYDQLVSNPTLSLVPKAVVDDITAWIVALSDNSGRAVHSLALPDTPATLDGEGFHEVPVRFGVGAHLSGMLCMPAGRRQGATVVFLSSAYDRHAGWGRRTAQMCRALATDGVASLRFDPTGVGDSPTKPDIPPQFLYHPVQERDVAEALDMLDARGLGPVVLAGRCSGAYLALQVAEKEPRVKGLVAVNPYTFRWRENISVENAIRFTARSLDEYGSRLRDPETFRRLWRGEIDVVKALGNLAKRLMTRARATVAYPFRFQSAHGRSVRRLFEGLKRQNRPLELIYSENDAGVDEYRVFFGSAAPSVFPNVRLTMIPHCDHNLSSDRAQVIYRDAVARIARGVLETDRAASAEA